MELISSGAEPIIDLVDILAPGRKGTFATRSPESQKNSPSADEKERSASESCFRQEASSALEPVDVHTELFPEALSSVCMRSEASPPETNKPGTPGAGSLHGEQHCTEAFQANSSESLADEASSFVVQNSQEVTVFSSAEQAEAAEQETAREAAQTPGTASEVFTEQQGISVEEREVFEAHSQELEARIVQLEQDVQHLAVRVTTLEAQLFHPVADDVRAVQGFLPEQPAVIEKGGEPAPEVIALDSDLSDEKACHVVAAPVPVPSAALSVPASFEAACSPLLEKEAERAAEVPVGVQNPPVGEGGGALSAERPVEEEPQTPSLKASSVPGESKPFGGHPVLDLPSLSSPASEVSDKEAFDALEQRILALETRPVPDGQELEERVLNKIREEMELFTVEQSASISKVLSEMRRRVRLLEARSAQVKTEIPDSATLAGEVLELIDKTLTVKVAEAAARVVREELAALTSEQA